MIEKMKIFRIRFRLFSMAETSGPWPAGGLGRLTRPARQAGRSGGRGGLI
jgi:hypothetical protein